MRSNENNNPQRAQTLKRKTTKSYLRYEEDSENNKHVHSNKTLSQKDLRSFSK